MKDQRLLLRKCLNNNIPANIFQGQDPCAIEILKSAEEIYKKNGCSIEFLYDFGCVRKNFEGYSNEHKGTFIMPKLINARGVKILNNCLYNDIPVIVFQGTDQCAVEIMKSAQNIYMKNGCSSVFLSKFGSFIDTFEEYGKNNVMDIKLPDLSTAEKDLISEDIEVRYLSAVERRDIGYLEDLQRLGYQPSDEVIKAAIRKDSIVISCIGNLSESLQFFAVQVSPYNIQGIPNPKDEVLIAAIQQCPAVFELIDKPSERVKIEAVKFHPNCIQSIPEPSKDVVTAAMLKDPYLVKHCNNVSEIMIKEIVEPYLSFKSAVENDDFSQFIKLKEQGYQPPIEVMKSLSSSFSVNTSVAVQKIFGIEMSSIPTAQLVLDMPTTSMKHHLSNAVEQSL